MAGKYGFILRYEHKHLFEMLPNESAGVLIKMMFAYAENSEVIDISDDPLALAAFKLMAGVIDSDTKKYEEKSAKRKWYSKKLNDTRWAEKRGRILDRDGNACTLCGDDTTLHVHHKAYLPDLEPWEYPDSMLTTLCGKCHKAVHGANHG